MTDEGSERTWEEAVTLKRMTAILESGGDLPASILVRDKQSGELAPLTWIDRVTVLAHQAVGAPQGDIYVLDLSSKTEEEIAALCRERITELYARKN